MNATRICNHPLYFVMMTQCIQADEWRSTPIMFRDLIKFHYRAIYLVYELYNDRVSQRVHLLSTITLICIVLEHCWIQTEGILLKQMSKRYKFSSGLPLRYTYTICWKFVVRRSSVCHITAVPFAIAWYLDYGF